MAEGYVFTSCEELADLAGTELGCAVADQLQSVMMEAVEGGCPRKLTLLQLHSLGVFHAATHLMEHLSILVAAMYADQGETKAAAMVAQSLSDVMDTALERCPGHIKAAQRVMKAEDDRIAMMEDPNLNDDIAQEAADLLDKLTAGHSPK